MCTGVIILFCTGHIQFAKTIDYSSICICGQLRAIIFLVPIFTSTLLLQNMQFRTRSHGYAVSTLILSERTINGDIYPLVKHFCHTQNTPTCSVLEVCFPAHSRLVVPSSVKSLFIFHREAGVSTVSVFCTFVMFQQLRQHLLHHLSLTCWRQTPPSGWLLSFSPLTGGFPSPYV